MCIHVRNIYVAYLRYIYIHIYIYIFANAHTHTHIYIYTPGNLFRWQPESGQMRIADSDMPKH